MGTSGPLILEMGSVLKITFRFFLWFLDTDPQSHCGHLLVFSEQIVSYVFKKLYSEKHELKWPFCTIRCWQICCAPMTTNHHWQIQGEMWLLPSWQGATISLKHFWGVGRVFLVFIRHSSTFTAMALHWHFVAGNHLVITCYSRLQLNTVGQTGSDVCCDSSSLMNLFDRQTIVISKVTFLFWITMPF